MVPASARLAVSSIAVFAMLMQAQANEDFDREILKVMLKQTEELINKELPRQVDDITTLANVRAKDATLHYWYKIDKLYNDDDRARWPSATKELLLGVVCNSGMEEILLQGGSYKFHYFDLQNVPLAVVTVEPSDCKI